MTYTFNERLDFERQLLRAICYDVARGALPPGDPMPMPETLAQELLLNPRVVESVYAKLVEAEVLLLQSGGGYAIAERAERVARNHLLRWAEEDVRDLVGALRRAALSAEEIERVFREICNA